MWDYMTSSISGNKKTETESFAPWKCLRLNNWGGWIHPADTEYYSSKSYVQLLFTGSNVLKSINAIKLIDAVY